MCHAVTCKQCGKTTWKGCGDHVESVKAQVPADQWCGHEASAPSSGGLIGRLLGR